MEKKKKIVVVGSCNTDMVVNVPHFPAPGETLTGSNFMTNQGGKGANQAVAVARQGGDLTFIARVGDDSFGIETLKKLADEGISSKYIGVTPNTPSGIAMISVDSHAENCIVIVAGANAALSEKDIEAAADVIREADIVLMQLETPLPTLQRAAEIAFEAGTRVVLNPAPFPSEGLPQEFLKLVDIVIPNETETQGITGITLTNEESYRKAFGRFADLGIRRAVITAGSDGAYTMEDGLLVHVPAVKTTPVDTTAAGDTFCGTLCVALTEGLSIAEAMERACKAAAVTVSRRGAWQAIPHRNEVL